MAKSNQNSEFIDIKGLLSTYAKKWHWFLISVIICGLAAVLFIKISKPKYEVHANVLISQEEGKGMSSFGGLGDIFGSSGYVEDEIFVINSHSVLRDVARDLGTYRTHIVKTGILSKVFKYKKFPVEVYPAPGIVDTLLTTVSFAADVRADGIADITVKAAGKKIAEFEEQKLPATLKTKYGSFVVDRTKDYPAGEDVNTTIYVTGYDVAAENLATEVKSSIASKKSNVIALSIISTDEKYGRNILNAIIAQYNDRGIAEKNRQNEKTAAFIDQRLALISDSLNASEADIQIYKQSQGIVDVSSETSYNMGLKSSAERALISAQTENEIIRITRDFLRDPEKAYDLIPTGSEISGVGSSIDTYNQLIMRRISLLTNAKANNVALKSLTEQIDAMRASINTSLDRAYQNSLIGVRDLQIQYNKAQGHLGNVPTQERAFLNLKRQQEVKQQLYLFLLQRREETAMLLANSVPKGQIIDNAYTLSEPVGMGKKMILAIAILLGLCFPPVILYLKKLMRNKFETRAEVEALTEIPVLGEMCTDHGGTQLVVSSHDTSSTSELFRLIRSNLQFMLSAADDKVILMTSTSSGEGKSFISINLAASLALQNKRVLLIGMDIRNPQLAKYLTLTPHTGVTQYLANPSIAIDDLIIREPLMPNLDIITAGPIPPNPGELLTGDAVDRLFVELRKRYDYIIVDTAPVGMVSDTFNLARISDATIYVCRANYTTLRDIQFINSIYNEKRLRKMSLVVNGTAAHKGYGYGYGSDKKHKKHNLWQRITRR